MAQVVNTNEFNSLIRGNKVTIVDFFATWCGPCKMLTPVFEGLSNEMGNQVNFAKVDIDQSMNLAQQYGISSVPTMLIFKNGVVVDKISGFVPKENIKSRIANQL